MTQIPAFSPSQISSQTSHNVPESVASAAKTSISTKSEQAVKYLKANPMKLRHRISKKFNLPWSSTPYFAAQVVWFPALVNFK